MTVSAVPLFICSIRSTLSVTVIVLGEKLGRMFKVIFIKLITAHSLLKISQLYPL